MTATAPVRGRITARVSTRIQESLADAVTRAHNAALAVGSAGIFVDAKDDAATRFFQHYGFIPCGVGWWSRATGDPGSL